MVCCGLFPGLRSQPQWHYWQSASLCVLPKYQCGTHAIPPAMRQDPNLVHFVYQMMFAIITPALITGAFVGRVKFKAYLIFITLDIIRLLPVSAYGLEPAGRDGLNGEKLIFAGGIVVHATADSLRLLPFYTSGVGHSTRWYTTFLILLWGRDYCGFGWCMGLTQALNYRLTQLLFLHFVTTDIAMLFAGATWLLIENAYR